MRCGMRRNHPPNSGEPGIALLSAGMARTTVRGSTTIESGNSVTWKKATTAISSMPKVSAQLVININIAKAFTA
jgi:hypothetical protein